MKKKLLLLLIVLSSLFMFQTNLFGGSGSNIGEGDGDVARPCNPKVSGTLCWNHSTNANNTTDKLEAMRISIVDKNTGMRLAGTTSIDYARNSTATEKASLTHLAKRSMYQFATKRTKNEVIKGLGSKSYARKTGYSIQEFGETNAFPPIFNKVGKNLKTYFLDLSSLSAPPENREFYKAKFFAPIGYDPNKNPNNNNKPYTAVEQRNHYLLIEPIIYIRVTKIGFWVHEFVGTATEVARMMTDVKQDSSGVSVYDLFLGGTGIGVPGKPKFSHNTANSHMFRRLIPTMIYVDAPVSMGGLTGISNWVADSNKNLAAEILTMNGTSAGHVWASPQDCNDLEYAKLNKTECCKELYNKHFLKDKTISPFNFLKKGEYYCCEDLTTKISGFKNNSLYKAICETPTPPPSKCTYKLDTQCTEDCFTQTEGYVKDIGQNNDMEDWKCIFDSPKSNLPKVRTHYKYNNVDNRYCQVFCREEVSYKLPGNGFAVDAGQHFTIGGSENNSDWSPIRFTGYLDCRTKGNGNNTMINHKKFYDDYEAADREVVRTYDKWQTEKVRDISREKAVKSTEKDCNWTCDKWYPTYPCANGKGICGGGCEKGSYKSYLYTPPTVTKGDYTATESKWCSDSGAPSSGTPSAERAYERALDDRTQLRDWIFECNNWTRNYNEFQPEVQLQFEEEEYGFYFGQLPGGVLTRTLTANNTTTTYYSGDQYNREKSYTETQIARADCADNYYNCSTNQQRYPNNDNKKYEVYKSYVYELANNVYQYVSKPQGYSSHKISANNQYIKIGYPNLPIHYSRLAGRYEISLKYTTFGSADKFTKYIFQKVAFPEATREYHDCLTTYECAYRVYNDFMECDPPGSSNCRKHAGLTVVYRPISLTNPFPGENAPSNGRRRGSNWSSSSDLLKITKNRGLTDPERIYFDRQPMYEITLNTQSILAIRNYNRTTKGGYSDFNLNCVIGQGRECKSNFIRSQFRHLFVTGRCGMSNSWNQCSVEDRN